MKKAIIFVFLLVFLQSVTAQDNPCDFEVEIAELQHVTCEKNGTILVNLTGPNIDDMPDKKYRAYLEGTTPSESDWTNENLLVSKEPGTYVVEAKALCQISGDPVIRQKTGVVLKRAATWVKPDFSVYTIVSSSLICINTGSIYLSSVKFGAQGPYTIELSEYPAAYTDDPVLYYSADTKPPAYGSSSTPLVATLAAGDYTIRISDGCDGGAMKEKTFTIRQDAYNIPTGLFTTTLIPKESENCNEVYFLKGSYSSSANGYHSSKLYEYAIFYTKDGEGSIQESDWKPVPDGSSVRIAHTLPYTVKEMLADPQKIANIKIRMKGGICPDTQVFMQTVGVPKLIIDEGDIVGCGKKTIICTFQTYQSYPTSCNKFTWQLNEVTSMGDFIRLADESTELVSATEDVTVTVESGKYYEFIATEPDGTTYTDSYTFYDDESYYQFDAWGFIDDSNESVCDELRFSGVYFSPMDQHGSLKVNTLRKARIVYDAAASSIKTPPKHTDVTLPADYFEEYYDGYWNFDLFFPFSTDYTQYEYLSYDDYNPGDYAVFNVTDSCGRVYSYKLTVPDYKTVEFTKTDEEIAAMLNAPDFFQIDPICEEPRYYPQTQRLAGLIKLITHKAGEVTTEAYPRVALDFYKYPVGYPSGSSSFYSDDAVNSKYFIPRGKGTYTFRIVVSPIWEARKCDKYIDVDIQDITYPVGIKTQGAAYRCPDNNAMGYIKAEYINGSVGPYDYYLFRVDNNREAITSDTLDKKLQVYVAEFDDWAGKTVDNHLAVRVYDKGCGRWFTDIIEVVNLKNVSITSVEGGAIRCLGEPIKLHARALGENVYTWTGPNGFSSTEQNPVIDVATENNAGTYTLSVRIFGCPNAHMTQDIDISVADRIMYWNPDAQDNNWNKKENWLIKTPDGAGYATASGVPAPCTTVHIGGYAQKFPNLDKAETPRDQFGVPTCDTIVYHYGSQMPFPHYLTYNGARVQYNFGMYGVLEINKQPGYNWDSFDYPKYSMATKIPRIDRARWYLISSPLKYMTGGDFSLAGRPAMYQRLYNAVNPQKKQAAYDSYTSEFNTPAQDLQKETGHALALWVPDYDPAYNGSEIHTNMEEKMYGVIEVPYLDNPRAMEGHYHRYDTQDSISYFGYYRKEPPYELLDRWDAFPRNYEAFRFAFEKEKTRGPEYGYDIEGSTVAIYRLKLPPMLGGSASRRLMIGNPLMCHIDFDLLYENNSDVLEDNYWYADPYNETFAAYRAGSEFPIDPLATKDIAPLQGFIVQIKDNATKDYLILPLEGNKTVVSGGQAPLPGPRSSRQAVKSAAVDRGWISVDALTPPRTGVLATEDSIKVRTSVFFNYPEWKNIPKLILAESDHEAKVEPFFVDKDDFLNSEQVENNYPSEVDFGIETEYKGDITFKLNKGGSIIKTIDLLDTATGKTHNMNNGGIYKFKNRAGQENNVDVKRFKLLLTYNITGIDTPDNDYYFAASVANGKLSVYSGQQIQEIRLFDALGKVLTYNNEVNNVEYHKELSLISGTYIVRAKLESGETQTRKIIVQ